MLTKPQKQKSLFLRCLNLFYSNYYFNKQIKKR